jgi:large conductance mechanosensitive channel
LLLGQVNFADLFIDFPGRAITSLAVAKEAGAATLNYGVFINTILDFVIVAFVVFLIVRQANKFKKVETPPRPPQRMSVIAARQSPSKRPAARTAPRSWAIE